jgi:hypothetical protein
MLDFPACRGADQLSFAFYPQPNIPPAGKTVTMDIPLIDNRFCCAFTRHRSKFTVT